MTKGTPPLGRRLLCLVYEGLLLTAVILLASGLATAISEITGIGPHRAITRITILAFCVAYFNWHWLAKGQTLPMKTWRIRVESVTGSALTPPQALLRFTYALITYPLFGLTIIWALFDNDRQFLHDRLAGTRLVSAH